MNVRKNIQFILLATFVLIFGTQKGHAQQDPMFVQYTDNLLIVNPGFAGSMNDGKFLLVSRNQWVSIPGAPTTYSFSYNTPVQVKNIGLGFSVMNDKIGPQKQTGVYFDYAHFIKISDEYKLGMGLKGGVSFYRAALTELDPLNPDPVFSQDIYRNFLPNLGIGFYLFSDKNYFGVSIPKMIENTITSKDYATEYIQREKIHFYGVMGTKRKFGGDFDIKASSMLKLVKGAPLAIDISVLAGLKERIWVGGMWRFRSSFGFTGKFQITDKMDVGYSYEIPFKRISNFSNGTHEIVFGYNFNVFK